MLTKTDLFEALMEALLVRDVPDAEEIADSVVECLDEDGHFNLDEEV